MSVRLPSSTRVRFRRFDLDLTTGELHKDGEKVALPPKAFEVLRALVESPGEVVTREQLRARLWAADTFVEFDDGLNHAVKKLRQTLRDSTDDPEFIETLPRYGYRFIASLESTREEASVVSPQRHPIPAVVLSLVVVAAMGLLLVFNVGKLRERLLPSLWQPPIRSIAVLPLLNLSGDPQQEYFAEGMTDALITDLAKMRELKVISRTSVMQFKDQKKSLPEIARALGVDGILEGSVQRSGEHIRVNAQLIHAPTDTHLWADSYEREARDVLALQGEIAQSVAREIKIALTPEESSDLERSRQVVPEAYEAYLKGQAHWYAISPGHADIALKYFDLALEKDPNYALAYVGIANVWLIRGDAGFMAPEQAFTKARAAVSRALDLDGSLADAHITLGNIEASYDRNWSAGEQEFRRAIELNPNSADAHFMYADFLISMKRLNEWEREIHRALELDPFNSFFQCFYAWHLIYLQRYDEAIAELRKVVATQPDFSSARMGLWGALYKKGQNEEALAEAEKFYAVLGDHEVEDALARGGKQGGYAKAMQLAANVLAARARKTHVPGIRIARLYAHAGEGDEVIRWLNRAYEQHETSLIHLPVAWDWDFVRTDPRFKDLLHRAGLPE